MALNCGGRPPDHTKKSGYLLMKKSNDINSSRAIESSQQVVTTTMFGSGSKANDNMLMIAGSGPCNYLGCNSNDGYRGVIGGYDGYGEGRSNSGPAAGSQLQVCMDHYYNHHEMKAPLQLQRKLAGGDFSFVESSSHIDVQEAAQLQLGSDHHHNHEGVERPQHQAAGGNGHVGSSSLQGGCGAAAVAQMSVGADHCGTHRDRELGSLALQLQASVEHHRTFFETSAAKMKSGVQPREDHHHQHYYGESSAALQKVVKVQGEADDRGQNQVEIREGNMPGAKSVQLYVKMSPGAMMQGGEEDQEGWILGKKRRLTNEQVKSLEVSFERERKLEAERKKELATELGLQPRQVAVWFQNRRARFKTKQLERDFDLLKHQYEAVRSHKDKLQAEVANLKRLLDAQVTTANMVVTPTPIEGEDDMDEDDMDEDQKSPTNSNKRNKIEAKAGTRMQNPASKLEAKLDSTRKQKAMSNQNVVSQIYAERADVLSRDTSGQTHVHAAMAIDLAPKNSTKVSFTEVKPSLKVPHIDHHHPLQQQLPNTFSPPTKLSLCSPQQLFLHHMLSMKLVEGDNFNLAHHEPHYNLYNDHYSFHRLDHNQEKEDGSDCMLCYNSTWHHDP